MNFVSIDEALPNVFCDGDANRTRVVRLAELLQGIVRDLDVLDGPLRSTLDTDQTRERRAERDAGSAISGDDHVPPPADLTMDEDGV